MCWAIRSLIETVDSVDKITDEFGNEVHGLAIIDTVTPQIATQTHAIAANLETIRSLTLALQSTLHSLIPQLDVFIHPLVDLAQAFDNAKNYDFFFLPPDALNTPDFKVGMDFFMTADGKSARIIVYHQGEAMSPEGIKQIQNVATVAQQSLKGTPLSNAKLSLAGASSNYRDIQDFSYNDLIIMMLATFGLVFLIVLVITRALIGSIIVLITVVLSFAWQLGIGHIGLGDYPRHKTALADHSDFIYRSGWRRLRLQPAAAFTLPRGAAAGIKTGLIRAMAGSGNVVLHRYARARGHDARATFQRCNQHRPESGSTICIGLIFDMLIVRLFLVMPLARLLGPWFWWPQRIPAAPGQKSAARPRFSKNVLSNLTGCRISARCASRRGRGRKRP